MAPPVEKPLPPKPPVILGVCADIGAWLGSDPRLKGKADGLCDEFWREFQNAPKGSADVYYQLMDRAVARVRDLGVSIPGNDVIRFFEKWVPSLWSYSMTGESDLPGEAPKDVSQAAPARDASETSSLPQAFFLTRDRDRGEVALVRPAPADGENVGLASYRAEEVRAIVQLAIASPIVVVFVRGGIHVGDRFFRELDQSLAVTEVPAGAASNETLSDPLDPTIIRLTEQELDGLNAPGARLVDESFLRNLKYRLVLVVEDNTSASAEDARRLAPALARIAPAGVAAVPAVAIGLKLMNVRQAGELLFGPGVWEGDDADEAAMIVQYLSEKIPLLPSYLSELKQNPPLPRFSTLQPVIDAYAKNLAETRDAAIRSGLRITSVPTAEAEEWKQGMVSQHSKSGVKIIFQDAKPFDEGIEIRLRQPSSLPNPASHRGDTEADARRSFQPNVLVDLGGGEGVVTDPAILEAADEENGGRGNAAGRGKGGKFSVRSPGAVPERGVQPATVIKSGR